MRKVTFVLFLVVLPIVMAVPAYSQESAMPFAHTACAGGVDLTGQTVSLYHILALIGDQTDEFLQPLKAGFDDATAYFNANGGICGATLAQVFADTEMSPQEIYDRDAALNPKPVLVTLYGSGDAEQLRDQLAQDEIPALGIRIGSVLGLYGEDGQSPGWVFGTNPLYPDQFGSLCKYISDHPNQYPNPVIGYLSWEGTFGEAAYTPEAIAYCASLGVRVLGTPGYFSDSVTYLHAYVQNQVDAGATILYTNSLGTGPTLIAKTLAEMGLQGKVTLAAVNWAMDPSVGLMGQAALGSDGLPSTNGMIGSLPLRSWAESDQPGIRLITEQADTNNRPPQVRNNFYILAWASTDLYIEVYVQTGNRVGFDHITGADIKETLENIVYSPLGGVETIDFQGGARRALSANRIGQMAYLGQDGKTPAGANNPPMMVMVDGQQNFIPMLVPLSDFAPAPDLRPGGADVVAADNTTITVPAAPAANVVSVAAGQITFTSHPDGDGDNNSEISVMNADGSGVIRLTNNRFWDAEPAWSPDGARIAFASGRDGNSEIYVMNSDGSDPTRLTDNPANEELPAWSPDGTRIVFISERDGNSEIYVMNSDGSDPTRLTNNPAFDGFPAWSPDGTKIAFGSERDGNPEIYVMNADGSGQTRLTNNPAFDGPRAWSPDGAKIAFVSDRDGNAEIYVMSADGSVQTNLTQNPAADSVPTWSPDGTKIAFVSDRDGNSEIYIMNADGSDPTRLTNNLTDDEWPAWSW